MVVTLAAVFLCHATLPQKTAARETSLIVVQGLFCLLYMYLPFFLFPSHFGMGIISHEGTCCCIGHRDVSLHRVTKFTLSVRFELAMASPKTTLDTNSIFYF